MDNRLHVCPVIIERGRGRNMPDRYVPVYINNVRSYGIHLEQVQTVGDLLDSMKVEDQHELDRDSFIIWKHQTTNVWCGGECVMAFGVAKESVDRWNMQEPTTFLVYISLTDDGRLVTAIPG